MAGKIGEHPHWTQNPNAPGPVNERNRLIYDSQVVLPLTSETMFNVRRHLQRRVRIKQKAGVLSVRIERQNSRGLYLWLLCLSTVGFALFCDMIWGAAFRNPHDAFYVLPVFALGLTCYLVAVAIAVWGAFGIEEIHVEGDAIRWTRTALNWTRIRNIPLGDITEIKAITPWYRLDNTVELTAARRQQRIGDKLLRDEALELAQRLRNAAGLTR